jgi:hypothetical protein
MFRSRRLIPSLTISRLCRRWALPGRLSDALRSARAFLRPLSQKCAVLTPFPATLTSHRQFAENTSTLSPAFATLTIRVKVNPFVCHSYRKHTGWGHPLAARILSPSFRPTVANLFRIRTYEKCAPNSFRIRTCKTRHLKPFRMNTYRKIGEGVP